MNKKNNYKKKIKEMTKERVLEELNNLRLQIFKAKGVISQGQNPNPEFPIKFLKWKIKYIKNLKIEGG